MIRDCDYLQGYDKNEDKATEGYMENREIYKELASTLYALQRCIENNNSLWVKNHGDKIKQLIDKLPHGAGIDGEYWFNEHTDPEKFIEFGNEYHLMNEHGFYDGWVSYSVKVYPHLFLGIKLKITGKFPFSYRDVKENLYEVYS